ncbi:uracil-DNA glycosylase family protein [Segetibacter koreensis]|uniref:uracil-DNA glycosylase family protein n=1 Tax=Segetibacter koreensis TaxID=398037 RepID=UPI00037E9623|nr:uracil-DNA glycosylase family protein [Segetibacter koreensis]
MLSKKILDFLFNLQFPFDLPPAVEVMHPFVDPETARIVRIFYDKYYSDSNSRYCIIGINPGRFGGGVTGIPFTDPIRLEKECGINNNWQRKQELSSVFVYDMITAFGCVEAFYNKFYFTAVSPLGFTRAGKNLNYYDDKVLIDKIIPFAVECFRLQISWGLETSVAFCLGEGTNYKFLSRLNMTYKLFDKIIPLSHPRFIMQYKLKTKDNYINKYLQEFLPLSK